MKKIITLLLTLIMILSTGVSVFAGHLEYEGIDNNGNPVKPYYVPDENDLDFSEYVGRWYDQNNNVLDIIKVNGNEITFSAYDYFPEIMIKIAEFDNRCFWLDGNKYYELIFHENKIAINMNRTVFSFNRNIKPNYPEDINGLPVFDFNSFIGTWSGNNINVTIKYVYPDDRFNIDFCGDTLTQFPIKNNQIYIYAYKDSYSFLSSKEMGGAEGGIRFTVYPESVSRITLMEDKLFYEYWWYNKDNPNEKKNYGSCILTSNIKPIVLVPGNSNIEVNVKEFNNECNRDNNDDTNSNINTDINEYNSFLDIDNNHWAYEYIRTLTEKNIINGYSDGTFKPDNNVTRAEFSKLLSLTADIKIKNNINFNDVNNNDWYYEYIQLLSNYMNNYDNEFKPNNNALRNDIIIAIVKLKNYNLENVDLSVLDKFTDVENNSDNIYIAAAIENNIINGFEDNTLRLSNSLTRAECVTVLYRLFE